MSENIISISFKIHSWMVKLLWEVRLHLALKAAADLKLASLRRRKQEDAFMMMALLRRA